MNETLLHDNTTIYYAIIVENVVVSEKFTSKLAADLELQKRTTDDRAGATVEAVDASGRRLLLG